MGWSLWQDEHARLVPISALQHFSYCPRQCALIHLEQIFEENVFTLKGRLEHERVDRPELEQRQDLHIERALPIWSERYGLIGRADVVELVYDNDGKLSLVTPVEYKHGKRHKQLHDELQLCAQAMCLEEMFELSISAGYIYHISSKKRRPVEIDAALRAQVVAVTEQVRVLLRQAKLPDVLGDARCQNCSLIDACMPYAISRARQNILPGDSQT